MTTAKRKRKPRPVFFVRPPSEWNGHKWYAESKKLGMRFGPYDNEAEAQASVDKYNAAVAL